MQMRKKVKPIEKTVSFKSTPDLRKWFEANHQKCDGIWLRISKKKSGKTSVNYAEALDEALCFGWIDQVEDAEGRFIVVAAVYSAAREEQVVKNKYGACGAAD